MKKRGKLVVISGPSGVGKSTVIARAIEGADNVRFSVSATTRPPRPGEEDGREYFFVSRDEFERMIRDGDLLEHAEFAGNCYGTPRAQVLDAVGAGDVLILDIEVQGAAQVKAAYPEAVTVFVLPPSLEELERRLTSRGTETPEKIALRLETARREIPLAATYDHQIINDDLANAAAAMKEIIFGGASDIYKEGEETTP